MLGPPQDSINGNAAAPNLKAQIVNHDAQSDNGMLCFELDNETVDREL